MSVCRHPRIKVSTTNFEGKVDGHDCSRRSCCYLSRERCERMYARRLHGRASALSVGRCAGCSHFSHRKLYIECGEEWKEGGLSSEFVILETRERAEPLPLTARSKGGFSPPLGGLETCFSSFPLWSYLW